MHPYPLMAAIGRELNRTIARDLFCAIIPEAHPLAQPEVVSTSDLACYPLIQFDAESDLSRPPD
jgi:hypothetical protein